MNKDIIKKIEQIAQILKHYNTENDLSLMGGGAGVALFLNYYAKYSKKEDYAEESFNIISDIFDKISLGNTYHTFAGGLAGIGWLVELFEQNSFLESDTDEIIGELDDYLFEYLQKELKNKHYDYLHGAAGIALYFLKRKKSEKKENYLTEFVNHLDKMSIKEENGIKWISDMMIDENSSKKVYNISMSHGIASLISILSKLYIQNINKEKTEKLLNGAINYISSQQFDIKDSLAYFPNSISLDGDKGTQSRLAWCYGDLGISVALWNASQAFNDKKLENKSLEILLHSSKRRNLQENSVVDAGLCHGTAGIAHIFNRMYINTGISEFKETSEYWFNLTLKMARFDDGLAGFKVRRTKDFQEWSWTNDYGFLEGIAGTGLALISAISDIEPKWDEALLLS